MSDGPTQTPESKIVFFIQDIIMNFFSFFWQTSVAAGSVFVCYVVVDLLHSYLQPLFLICQIWSNAAYIHSLITFTLTQCSTYRTKPGNTFAWITLTTHACTNFFKILQGSSNLCKTQYVLYFLNYTLHIVHIAHCTLSIAHCTFQHHFSASYVLYLGLLYGAYRRPMDAIFW